MPTLDLGNLKAELDSVVNEATSVVDLVDKYADILGKFGGDIPGAGPDVALAVKALDDLDKALHVVQNVLNAA